MVIVTQFGIGDIVSVGPIEEAIVTRIVFASVITYEVTYWNDKVCNTYTAWEWELSLVKKFIENKGD